MTRGVNFFNLMLLAVFAAGACGVFLRSSQTRPGLALGLFFRGVPMGKRKGKGGKGC